ncbi:MAG TPA: TatD family hydrolase [Planctomycetota bacterium]|jgi:TatD DNase family protein|nr:TatD family hydrolase [Planctomycetota bacterium]
MPEVTSLRLVDTHAHLDPSFFGEEVEGVLRRAREAGVCAIVCVGTDGASSERALALARRETDVVATAGVHPHDARSLLDPGLTRAFEALASDPGFVAVGETGLDYFKNYEPREVQRAAFALQVRLAARLRRPLVLHCREAFRDLLEILDAEGGREAGGVFHCFSMGREEARAALERGFFVSFSGTVTYPRSEAVREAARFVPTDRLLVETDSPFLPPQPVRKEKRNEPAFVRHTLERIAQERKEGLEELASQVAANASRLFRLPLA